LEYNYKDPFSTKHRKRTFGLIFFKTGPFGEAFEDKWKYMDIQNKETNTKYKHTDMGIGA